ncbi:hypothetical protein [Fodinicola feengrottensis]|uniref:hypothetical protein n=1 Tax=Fodinicola feengrottensis TaxID=435914 RepID=UPI0013D1CBA7|nr:hypothetical protein [Fodinicola feengrottensis]
MERLRKIRGRISSDELSNDDETIQGVRGRTCRCFGFRWHRFDSGGSAGRDGTVRHLTAAGGRFVRGGRPARVRTRHDWLSVPESYRQERAAGFLDRFFDTTQVASSPASTVDSEGRVYLAVRATNGNVLYQWREPNGSWTGWKNIGGTTYGAPALQAIPAQNGQYPEVLIAAQNSAGQPQARAFTPGTLSPPIAHWASWVGLDDQVLQAAPMLGAAQGCQDTPRDGAPDSAQPNAVVLLGRGSNGNGMQREVCGDAPSPAPATWFLNSEGTSSGIASDSHGGVWFRGTDGALWDGTRVGVPAAGRRVACTPTVAGYQVPKNGGTPTDPRSVLVRDDQGTSWLYVPVEEDGTGGTWTNLGGIAT